MSRAVPTPVRALQFPHAAMSSCQPWRSSLAGPGGSPTYPSSPTAGPAPPASPDVLTDAVLRYHYYVEVGVDAHRHVAPFREEWAGNALGMVPPAPPAGVSQAYYDALLRQSLDEMRTEYASAVKRSIVTYVLGSPVERRRLDLVPLEPLLAAPTPLQLSWAAVVDRDLGPTWRADVDAAREEVAWTLQTLSANALELSRLWHEGCGTRFSSALLCAVDVQEVVCRLPMAAEAWAEVQGEVTEAVKAQLWTSWAPKSLEVCTRLPPVFINGDADAYFRSIATLQSNQLRGLVARSLERYVAFFEQHQPPVREGAAGGGSRPSEAVVDPQQDTLMWSVPPVYVLDLMELDGEGLGCGARGGKRVVPWAGGARAWGQGRGVRGGKRVGSRAWGN